jgi:hypothetical protein
MFVNHVQLIVNKMLQIVTVLLICMKTKPTLSVKLVHTNVNNVTLLLTIVYLVPEIEFLPQVVSVQTELTMIVLPTQNVKLVTLSVVLVLAVMVLV